MVIRGSDLDEPLQELFEIGLRREPERLPRFVGLPELLGVEVLDALQEVVFEVGFIAHWLSVIVCRLSGGGDNRQLTTDNLSLRFSFPYVASHTSRP